MMKRLLSSSGLIVMAFALLAITNIIVLLGVNANRSGELTSKMTLTERELRLPYSSNSENSGVALRMVYRVLDNDTNNTYAYYNSPAWLNSEKLKALGFDTDKYVNAKYPKKAIPKEVLLVLENDGEAYKRSLKRVNEVFLEHQEQFHANPKGNRIKERYETAKKDLQRESLTASRLFVVDTGLDYAALRRQYSDKSRFLIVKGTVQLIHNEMEKRVFGYIQALSIKTIHIPLEHKETVSGLAYYSDEGPRYSAVVHYGSRYEPWIISIKHLDGK